tara:strand:+ start:252 stop:638 length:387 start_codon:yes stop_codon:yes gene_type:complete
MKDKTLKDFLPNKNTSYNKQFNISNNLIDIKEEQVIECIKTVMDPEIPVNLYDLGLIYEIQIINKNDIKIKMTLTNPNCPVASSMPESVGKSIEKIPNVNSIEVSLVWQPKWNKNLMSEEAKLALDIF